MKKFFQTFLLATALFTSGKSFSQVPVLSSYPSASAVIFLDFDGHTVEGTIWNSSGPIACGASNLNSTQITEVYNRIAEDYRPFNINVTTDSTKYWSAPTRQRMRVIFTTSSSWYGSAGGVAYTNSFTWGDNTPCFVFTALLNYSAKNVSEAASHEAGHTLGLRHQANYDGNCVKTSDYHQGTGSGEIAWAPIMGVGYYRNFTVWHNGPNPNGCNNTQSDLDIITSAANGFGFRVDDHADDIATATVTTFTNNKFNVDGVVSKTADKDVFRFIVGVNSRFQLDGVPYNVGAGNTGSDLDMQVELLNSSEQILGTYNPGTALHSILDTTLSAGTYYLRIDGKGNMYASEYGSLGSYSLEGTISLLAPLPLRKLDLKGSTSHGNHTLSWSVDADETITKQIIEVSANGRPFESLEEVSANARNYTYTPAASKVLQYRMNITFNNGRQYYSNVITLQNTSSKKPHLVTNVITSSSVMVNSPATYNYQINDYSGRVVAHGNVTQGASSITTGFLMNGIYLIKFSKGNEQYIEKFVKQ
jgi:hypothetical protein